jgi:hypothetical protein
MTFGGRGTQDRIHFGGEFIHEGNTKLDIVEMWTRLNWRSSVVYVAPSIRREMHTKCWSNNLKGGDHLKDLDVDRRITLILSSPIVLYVRPALTYQISEFYQHILTTNSVCFPERYRPWPWQLGRNVFLVRYELNFYILFRRNSVVFTDFTLRRVFTVNSSLAKVMSLKLAAWPRMCETSKQAVNLECKPRCRMSQYRDSGNAGHRNLNVMPSRTNTQKQFL